MVLQQRDIQILGFYVCLLRTHTFRGVVESISAGSGTAFSLLPPEQATGTWVKVTQRMPVKIVILNPSLKFPLIVGASASVTVDTTH